MEYELYSLRVTGSLRCRQGERCHIPEKMTLVARRISLLRFHKSKFHLEWVTKLTWTVMPVAFGSKWYGWMRNNCKNNRWWFRNISGPSSSKFDKSMILWGNLQTMLDLCGDGTWNKSSRSPCFQLATSFSSRIFIFKRTHMVRYAPNGLSL